MNRNFLAALERFKAGEIIIVVDDHDRENEGDLIMLAEAATPEQTAFIVRHTTGILCVAITGERAFELRLPLMAEQNQDERKTAFTVSVDLREGITTGVSAIERTATIRALGNPQSIDSDFIRPGHVFPLIAHNEGLTARQGHTEAGVALAQLVGAQPAALLSEIVAEDGSMARGETLENFAREHDLPIVSIKEIYEHQQSLSFVAPAQMSPDFAFNWADVALETGTWSLATYPSLRQREHVVMRFGTEGPTPLVRMHSECFTGDVLHSQRCDCGEQLAASIELIQERGYGYIIYLRDHEGRGIGLSEKLRAYILQDDGLDTVDANLALGHEVDLRDWTDSIRILRNLGLENIELLTNNPEKVAAVVDSGIICKQITLSVSPNPFNSKYLQTKIDRLGHTRSS